MNKSIKLSGRELDVLKVLWESEKPLTAKEVSEANPLLSINTVRTVLKGLIKKEYIKVSDIVYSGTVLTQSYVQVISAEEYLIHQMKSIVKGGFSGERIIASVLEHEDNELETIKRLESMLKKRREAIAKDDEAT